MKPGPHLLRVVTSSFLGSLFHCLPLPTDRIDFIEVKMYEYLGVDWDPVHQPDERPGRESSSGVGMACH